MIKSPNKFGCFTSIVKNELSFISNEKDYSRDDRNYEVEGIKIFKDDKFSLSRFQKIDILHRF